MLVLISNEIISDLVLIVRDNSRRRSRSNDPGSTPPEFSNCALCNRSVSVSGRVILWRNHQTPSFLCAFVNRFNNVDEFLFVLQDPVEFVVVTRAKITHHMLVAEEKHERHRVVKLVHLLEIGHLVEIADVDDGEVLDT